MKKDFRVLLINCNTMLDTLITAGIGILSSCLRQRGIEVRLFDTTFYRTAERTGDDARAYALQVKRPTSPISASSPSRRDVVEDFVRAVESYRPDLIGLSCIEVTFPLGMPGRARHTGIPTIVGDRMPPSRPRSSSAAAVDMVCVGEARTPWSTSASAWPRAAIFSPSPTSGPSATAAFTRIRFGPPSTSTGCPTRTGTSTTSAASGNPWAARSR